MTQWFFDHRWCAPHGIGRFASEVRRRLVGFQDLQLEGRPTAMMDPWRLAKHLKQTAARGFFSPGFNVPAWVRCPVITTIHDLIHVHFRGERSTAKQAYYRFVQRPVVRDSPVTLTVSEFSRRQIIHWYDLPASSVRCVGNGVSEQFRVDGEAYVGDRPYFLYVGNNKPHKSVSTLLEATAHLRRRHDVSLKLVCRLDDQLRQQVERLKLHGVVDFRCDLSDAQLAMLYRGAEGLVLPSRYEGFGLPLVEAMACGCVPIGSQCTSIPEVIGNAGFLFEPGNAEALADSMSMLLEDERRRSEMRQTGLQRSALYRWDAVAGRVHQAVAPFLSAA